MHTRPVLRRLLRLLVPVLVPVLGVQAQDGATALAPLVRGLGVSARVLVIAAHPDDEETQLITWLSKGRQVETAYLSLTRGDGGQNLIGNELGEALGIIRTEELLAARRIDGGRQYFTRAYDFGFSKSSDETFRNWDHDTILRDVVTVVRAFRPHVIVSVFSGTPRDGHGHHQAAGILAREAYDVSGDSARYSAQATAGHAPWTVSKFYRLTRGDGATLRINVGEFDPVLGRSYAEIAAESRSQHKSQGFGMLQRRGARFTNLTREAMRVPAPDDARTEGSIFDGIDTTWRRFDAHVTRMDPRQALEELPSALAAVSATIDLATPSRMVPTLVRVQSLLRRMWDPHANDGTPKWLPDGTDWPTVGDGRTALLDLQRSHAVAFGRVNEALRIATGLVVEAQVGRRSYALGESLAVTTTVYNRGQSSVEVFGREAGFTGAAIGAYFRPPAVRPDSAVSDTVRYAYREHTAPWWLEQPRRGAMFGVVPDGTDEATRTSEWVGYEVRVAGGVVHLRAPVVYRYADPVRGDVSHPVSAEPAVTLTMEQAVSYARAAAAIARTIRVSVRAAADSGRAVAVALELPSGLTAVPRVQSVTPTIGGGVQVVEFRVRGTLAPGRHEMRATASQGGSTFTTGYVSIDYEHIRPQKLYRSAATVVEAIDVRIPAGVRVGYVRGVGDEAPAAISALGIPLTELEPSSLGRVDLGRFSAIVVGPRAYEAHAELRVTNGRLLDFARRGGTLVVQYGQYEMTQAGMMPYPITLARPADRVTVEDAPVRVIDSTARVVTSPNRISTADFEGWIQDRTLYMPRTFDPRYRPVLEMNDPGEPPNRGALLVAPLGQGTYVYTSLAFFRQLPNGTPGAMRLFVNLLVARAARGPAM